MFEVSVRLLVAAHPLTSRTVLSRLLGDRNLLVAQMAAAHIACDTHLLVHAPLSVLTYDQVCELIDHIGGAPVDSQTREAVLAVLVALDDGAGRLAGDLVAAAVTATTA